MVTAVPVTGTSNSEIDGLLSGVKWSGTFTYSFPDSSADYGTPYGGNGEPTIPGFAPAPSQVQAAIDYAVGLTLSYTNANIQYAGTDSADIMVAQSPAANPTAYAYSPSNVSSGGDIWFGTAYNYALASLGNYSFMAALHEVGHAVGLKHSHESGGVTNVSVPSVHDSSEYTVMSYRSYVGGPLTGQTNEAYGYPQTYMADDISALQTLYGANYATHSENTVYSWTPTTGQKFINDVAQPPPGGGSGGSANRIFETIWDGGGVDTYDLSNYTTNLTINLNPGASSVFSAAQLAYQGNGHYAAGNVYNAYSYNDDPRSCIESVIGGSGNDMLIGNEVANVLNGGAGNETITGGGGNDSIIGGSGADTAVYSDNQANYALSYDASSQAFTISHQGIGSIDGTDTVTGIETFQFADRTIDSQVFQTFFQTSPSAPNLPQFGQQSVTGNAAPSGTVVSLFSSNPTPSVVSVNDPNSVELGFKFQASSAGDITGLRFYKAPSNTGTHAANLWTSTGTLLATATFGNETASGWQQVNFATPVTITPGTTYVASYHTSGNYSADPNLFNSAVTNGPLTAPSSASSGGNGVYAYGSSSLFPTNSFNATSYGVDVLFRPQLAG